MKMLPSGKPVSSSAISPVWSVLEARETVPGLIAVASATPIEDTERVARGLADVAAEAGKRTGYLYLGTARRSPADQTLRYVDLTLMSRQSMRESFDVSLASWRTSFDVIIIELPDVLTCALGAHVARLADEIVIAIFPGRKVDQADRDLTALFRQLSATIAGVVRTAAIAPAGNRSPAARRSLVSRFFPVRQP